MDELDISTIRDAESWSKVPIKRARQGSASVLVVRSSSARIKSLGQDYKSRADGCA